MNYEYLIVAGGYRTGSTLQYNLYSTYLELTGEGERLGFGYASELAQDEKRETIGVVKTHYLGGWEYFVLRGVAFPALTTRDLFERERSFRKFFRIKGDVYETHQWKESEMTTALWEVVANRFSRGGVYEIGYTDLMTKPAQCAMEIAHELKLEPNWDAAKEAARLTSRTVIETPNRGRDERTLLHWNHFSS